MYKVNSPLYQQGGSKVGVKAISVYSAVTFFGLINQNYCGFFEFNFTTCESRLKPDKHYGTSLNHKKLLQIAHLDCMGLYWDEIDRQSENIL